MKKNSLFILIVWIGLIESSKSATYSVFSGQSIQAKIDAASSGDTVAIFGGTYTENLTVSKDVRLQLVAGQTVTLAGNITFSGLINAYTFSDFTFGGQSDKAITINNCKSFTLSSVKSTVGNILITGSECKANIFNCSLTSGNITVSDQATADFARCTVTGNVTVNSSVKRATFSRSTVTGTIDSSAGQTYVAYSSLRLFKQRNSGKAFILGSIVRKGSGYLGNTIEIYDASQLSFLNSIVREGADSVNGWFTHENIAIWVAGAAKLFAMNSIIYDYSAYNNSGAAYARAIRLAGTAFNRISSNIGYAIQNEFVYGPFANNTVTYNLSQTGEGGGVLLQNRLNADPAFVNTTDFVLGPTSPARNAGDPDPRFNDIDGTRNDMGIYGGPFYDPEGRTGSKPVVMQMELDQTQFLKGDYSTLKLKAVGSATGTAP
jgi:hypothetical protein